MINSSIYYKLFKWFFKFWGFLLETIYSSQFCEFELKLNISLTALEHVSWHLNCSYTLYIFLFYCFCANLQSALCFTFCFFFFFVLFLCLCPYPSTMPRKTRANRTPSLSSMSPSRSQLCKNDCCREVFEKLNYKRKIWAERYVVLDEIDPAIKANLESRGWLSLLEVDHPPPTALIREFYSNLSCHIYDANTLVRSWIRGVEFTITPRVVAEALGVPVFKQARLSLCRVSTLWWRYVIHYWVFYPVGFWSSNHTRWAYWDYLSFL